MHGTRTASSADLFDSISGHHLEKVKEKKLELSPLVGFRNIMLNAQNVIIYSEQR
jgi:hypothetical protein